MYLSKYILYVMYGVVWLLDQIKVAMCIWIPSQEKDFLKSERRLHIIAREHPPTYRETYVIIRATRAPLYSVLAYACVT
jgi:hypothetical protein